MSYIQHGMLNLNGFDQVFKNGYKPDLKDPDVEYEKNIHYLVISSKDRNLEVYPSVSNYKIELPETYYDIKSIDLIQSIIPDKNSVTLEPYLLLKIDEIDDVMNASNTNIAKSFAMLQMTSPVVSGGFINIDKKIHEQVLKIYKTPKASLSTMTISIRDCDGNIFSFGTGGNTLEKNCQNTLVFRIVTIDKDRSKLNTKILH